MANQEVLAYLREEEQTLLRRAREALDKAEAFVADLRIQLNDGAAGMPYYRRAGNGVMAHADPIDLSVVNAAFDAIERVALLVTVASRLEEEK